MWENKTDVNGEKNQLVVRWHHIFTWDLYHQKQNGNCFFSFSIDWISVAGRQGGYSIEICHQFHFQFLFKKKKKQTAGKGQTLEND